MDEQKQNLHATVTHTKEEPICSLYCKQNGPRSDCSLGSKSVQGSYEKNLV